MRTFQDMPTYAQWKKDSGVLFAMRTSDPVLRQIDGLIKIYWMMPDSRSEICYQLYRVSKYWTKNIGGKVKGAVGRKDAIEELNAFLSREFMRIYDLDREDLDQLLTMVYGKPVHVAYEDNEVFNENRSTQYIRDETERRRYKLVFRKGLAYKRMTEGGLEKYDTKDETGKDDEPGEAIFVMDRDGRIYTGSYARSQFHHSSFLAGGWSLAAGVMKITRGQVETVCPDSGHYQPGVQQMLNVVERLKTYDVNLTKLTVKLFQYETEGIHKGERKIKFGNPVWENIRGDVFLNRRS